MFRKTIIISLCCLFWAGLGYAQQSELNAAINALNNNNLPIAKAHIDVATLHVETKNLAETWYYRLYIYKEIFKAEEPEDRFSPAREEAWVALLTLINKQGNGEFMPSAIKSGKYITSTYYNNAVADLQNQSFDYSELNYEKFKEGVKLLEPSKNLVQEDTKYYQALASGYMNLYESNRQVNEGYYEKSKEVYLRLLDKDIDNWNANYNLGTLIYNRAVSIIKTMEYDTDLYSVDKLQAECVKLFFTSLPYMQKAHEINPTVNEPVAGLTGIYYSLHEEDQYLRYKSMLVGNRH